MIEVWQKESHRLLPIVYYSESADPTLCFVWAEIFFILHHIFPLFHIREKIFTSHREAFFVLGFQTANSHSLTLFDIITFTSDSEQKCKRVHICTSNLSNQDQKYPQLFLGKIRKYFRNIWENLSASLLYPSLSSANKGKSLRTNIIRSIRTSSNYQHHQHHHQHHHHQ